MITLPMVHPAMYITEKGKVIEINNVTEKTD